MVAVDEDLVRFSLEVVYRSALLKCINQASLTPARCWKVGRSDEGSTSASTAVVTGSSDRYEKHLGRKDRVDSITAYSVTILSQLILSSSLAKNLFDSIAAPSMLSIPFCSQRPLLGRN
ncbi:hypothetical protein L1987_49043 [Smallanthus sonchifolius]|uniref:Uncharacterized protein n=1 Tax=Smallanthus sonchifolius TaxID=185202 RepID=A0ACB9FUK6_9ASTR|nr:hypothetical protein L1987_49043 [Smallanthus sonchifolius]